MKTAPAPRQTPGRLDFPAWFLENRSQVPPGPWIARGWTVSIELAEKLKQKLTDKWVVVDGAIPELRRFNEWTGRVKTVNMNGRALVEFDGPVDIGWYDIDPAFLTVVEGPRPKVEKHKEAPAAKPAATAPKPAGVNPLEAARAQGAAKAAAPTAGGKLSPMEMIRQQQAAKAAAAAGGAPPAPVATAPAEAPAPAAEPAPKPAAAPVPTTGPDGKKLSPLELARLQGAAKKPS